MTTNKRCFVFGSNLAGRSGKGSALEAVQKHGAKYGVGIGRTGNAYAIPTKDKDLKVLPLGTIAQHIDDFIEYAKDHPTITFDIVAVGQGLAGYTSEQISPMFEGAPDNCHFINGWRT